MKNVLFFNSMLTPKLVTALYWLMLVVAVIAGIITMFSGYSGFTFSTFLTGLATILGGAIGARIWCELMIVVFKINENLQAVNDSQKA
ncbi:DUF4282 domain-containing protein [Vibrio maerlii]|uniref:DUF4282 domain-containing protein n=1 Tax=Vibrio maerlii TaxID=2231648 RepID=UPI000E3D4296|nr:DUF4282 domain-containing protein [Vibrio maerlii]